MHACMAPLPGIGIWRHAVVIAAALSCMHVSMLDII